MTTVPSPVMLPLAEVHDPIKNPNHMPADRYALLVKAIAKSGFLQPVLVRQEADGYRIVDGFHRCKAARELGLTEVSAVVVADDEAAAAVLQVGMNRLRGELNLAEVADLFVDLAQEGYGIEDLTVTGFTADEIDALMERAHPSDDDALGEDFGGLEEEEAAGAGNRVERPFLLELTFADGATLRKVKRKLKKAAGKGKPIEEGLMNILEGN